jgi:hypothetical protein
MNECSAFLDSVVTRFDMKKISQGILLALVSVASNLYLPPSISLSMALIASW